jgi:hypothetical protein
LNGARSNYARDAVLHVKRIKGSRASVHTVRGDEVRALPQLHKLQGSFRVRWRPVHPRRLEQAVPGSTIPLVPLVSLARAVGVRTR